MIDHGHDIVAVLVRSFHIENAPACQGSLAIDPESKVKERGELKLHSIFISVFWLYLTIEIHTECGIFPDAPPKSSNL